MKKRDLVNKAFRCCCFPLLYGRISPLFSLEAKEMSDLPTSWRHALVLCTLVRLLLERTSMWAVTGTPSLSHGQAISSAVDTEWTAIHPPHPPRLPAHLGVRGAVWLELHPAVLAGVRQCLHLESGRRRARLRGRGGGAAVEGVPGCGHELRADATGAGHLHLGHRSGRAEPHHRCRHLCRGARDVVPGISPSHQHHLPLLPGERCSGGGGTPSPVSAGTTTHHRDTHRRQRAADRPANCSRDRSRGDYCGTEQRMGLASDFFRRNRTHAFRPPRGQHRPPERSLHGHRRTERRRHPRADPHPGPVRLAVAREQQPTGGSLR